MRKNIGIILLCVLIGGCSPLNREELAKEVLKADPAFKAVLEKHHELANRIQTYERELALKRATIERSISQLRRDLSAAISNAKAKTDTVKKQMAPDRERLELALSMASEETRNKRLQRSNLNRSIATRKNALKRDSAGWTKEERLRQESQIEDMARDIKRLNEELAILASHIRLLKIKLMLIKF